LGKINNGLARAASLLQPEMFCNSFWEGELSETTAKVKAWWEMLDTTLRNG